MNRLLTAAFLATGAWAIASGSRTSGYAFAAVAVTSAFRVAPVVMRLNKADEYAEQRAGRDLGEPEGP